MSKLLTAAGLYIAVYRAGFGNQYQIRYVVICVISWLTSIRKRAVMIFFKARIASPIYKFCMCDGGSAHMLK